VFAKNMSALQYIILISVVRKRNVSTYNPHRVIVGLALVIAGLDLTSPQLKLRIKDIKEWVEVRVCSVYRSCLVDKRPCLIDKLVTRRRVVGAA
jgi:hypothetical protein